MKHRPHCGVFGWAVVTATVVIYDVWAISTDNETLSSAFWRAKQHRLGKVVVGGVWLGLTWHMLVGDHRILPERYHSAYTSLHPLHLGWRKLKERVPILDAV